MVIMGIKTKKEIKHVKDGQEKGSMISCKILTKEMEELIACLWIVENLED